jgi:uncharacterized protein (UPF0264 family)
VRLLVSVSDAADARAALDGGADIVDAKDPSSGGLGAVEPSVLRAIHAAAHPHRPVSAALGDAWDEGHAERGARAAAAVGLAFVKVGFRHVVSIARVRSLVAAAVRGARAANADTRVIAVAYADAQRAQSVAPDAIHELAASAGAAGVLLDTAFKDGGGLFAYLSPDAVGAWVEAAHAAGLLTAVAGKLDGPALVTARDLGADIVGVRGAACEGGRAGRVSAARVRALAALVSAPAESAAAAAEEWAQALDVSGRQDGRSHVLR